MSSISIFCFVIVFLIIVSSFRKGTDIFSPSRIFTLVWAIAIGLMDLKLSRYQHEWSDASWIVLFGGLSSFLLGIFSIYILSLSRTQYHDIQIFRVKSSVICQGLNDRSFFHATLLIFIIYIIAYLIEVLIAGYVPMFSDYPDRARMSFGTFGVHLLVSLAPTIMILSSEYFILFRSQRRYGLIFFIILVITFFSYAFLLQRFFFLMWISISLVIAYYFTKYVNIKSVLISVALLVGLIIYLQSIRLSHYVQNYIYLISEMRYSIDYAIFTEPYMYIVMNLENFARGIEKLTQFSIGYYTLDPLLALLGLKHTLSEYFNLIDRPFLTSGYNTFPFLWVYYRDFGFFGMVICCFILGAMISFFYYRFLSNPTVTKCLIYAILVFFMVISFFTNIFSMLNVILNITLLIFVHKYARMRKPLNIIV